MSCAIMAEGQMFVILLVTTWIIVGGGVKTDKYVRGVDKGTFLIYCIILTSTAEQPNLATKDLFEPGDPIKQYP